MGQNGCTLFWVEPKLGRFSIDTQAPFCHACSYKKATSCRLALATSHSGNMLKGGMPAALRLMRRMEMEWLVWDPAVFCGISFL